jgi:2',3'-cyclic-nucleotide 3'-phosphodiesterase
MKTLIILRGLPGSGKSTLVAELEKQLDKKAVVCSADYYFYFGKEHKPENYSFNRELLGKAHGQCKYNACKAMDDGEELVIIDNTNIRLAEYKFYALNAEERGYKVLSHAITGLSAEESSKLNVHNVPLEACVRMLSAYEKCPRKILGKEDTIVEVEEIKHDYLWMRKGIFGNGSFSKNFKKTGKNNGKRSEKN